MITYYLRSGLVQKAITERKWQAIADFIKGHTHPVFILSAIRNPIDRNMSAFFQHLELDENSNAETLIKRFIENYAHQVPLKWFDEQFNEALGIDIYRYPFDKVRGWRVFSQDNYHCLLMTAETENSEKAIAINSFLGSDLKNIEMRNVGAGKGYSDIYRKFKDRIKLPESYVNGQLNSQIVSYFYTCEQIEEFRSKWV